MADVIGMSDVSTPDTGKGSQLKTGGGKRKHNMPSKNKCATIKDGTEGWKKMGYKNMQDCMSYGKKKMSKTQKPLESPMQARDKVGSGIATSMNARMKKINKKNSMKSGY